jgi:hypothetical protein
MCSKGVLISGSCLDITDGIQVGGRFRGGADGGGRASPVPSICRASRNPRPRVPTKWGSALLSALYFRSVFPLYAWVLAVGISNECRVPMPSKLRMRDHQTGPPARMGAGRHRVGTRHSAPGEAASIPGVDPSAESADRSADAERVGTDQALHVGVPLTGDDGDDRRPPPTGARARRVRSIRGAARRGGSQPGRGERLRVSDHARAVVGSARNHQARRGSPPRCSRRAA